MYARRPRKAGWVLGALLVVGATGAVIGAAVRLVPTWVGIGPSPRPSASPSPMTEARTCATARLGGAVGLGLVAWVRDGALHLLDLGACDERILVQQDAAPPVRFSPDGRWVAFGEGVIVPTEGGQTRSPLGRLTAWQWSPDTMLMAGVTPGGGVILGGPTQPPKTVLSDGAEAESLAFSRDGSALAVGVGGDRVQVLDVAGGAATTIYRVSAGIKAPPLVAGWSPDGRWVLFFSRFPGREAVPLNAAPIVGGAWANVFEPVLPHEDFLTWCKEDLVFAGGAERMPSEGNQVLVSSPPGWRFRNVSDDYARSWIWPACSPDGQWIAVAAAPNRPEIPAGQGVRSLWLLSTDAKRRVRVTGGTDAAYEAPRWSADGRFILVARRGLQPDSPGTLVLLRVEPSSGKAHRIPGPVARIGPAPGERGHGDWSDVSDWHRPG